MRTTVDIDARMLERAKRHASSTGQTLGSVVSAALTAYLASTPAHDDPPFELIVRGRPGATFPSKDEITSAEELEEVAGLRIRPRGRRAAS